MKPTERFSCRVENYVKYRPGYPTEVLRLLQSECALTDSSVVADVGSGTGISTELLLMCGAEVYAVEPNDAMRKAAELRLSVNPRFKSVKGLAEHTGLKQHTIDLVASGQAFHWFSPQLARQEFDRILKPDGRIALFWNDRLTSGSSFLEQYEHLLKEYAPEYPKVDHKRISFETIQKFSGGHVRQWTFQNAQRLDFKGLKGRLLSSSYAPEKEESGHAEMLHELRLLFEANEQDGLVEMSYQTEVFIFQIQ